MQNLLEEKYSKSKALRKEEHVLSCTNAIRVDFLWEKAKRREGDKNNGSGNYRWKNYGQRTSGRSP